MAWHKVFLLSVFLLIGNTLALRKRIINGNSANIEDFPYQVSIQSYDEHFCGGAIISERHILTAAHCTKEHMRKYPGEYSVVFGTSFSTFDNNGHFYDISNVTVHPEAQCMNGRCLNDVAVIKLKNPIVFGKTQQKINLPEKDFKSGDKANVTGWGIVQEVPQRIEPNVLQMIETKLISLEECRNNLVGVTKNKIYDTEICAFRSDGTGVCKGDSGGPLVVNGEVVGIVSWSPGNHCAEGHPDIYTNVYKFKDFVKSAMN